MAAKLCGYITSLTTTAAASSAAAPAASTPTTPAETTTTGLILKTLVNRGCPVRIGLAHLTRASFWIGNVLTPSQATFERNSMILNTPTDFFRSPILNGLAHFVLKAVGRAMATRKREDARGREREYKRGSNVHESPLQGILPKESTHRVSRAWPSDPPCVRRPKGRNSGLTVSELFVPVRSKANPAHSSAISKVARMYGDCSEVVEG